MEEGLQNALDELDLLPRKPIKVVAKQHGFDKSIIQFGCSRLRAGEFLKKSGRKCTFTV